jgi:transposase-like protein
MSIAVQEPGAPGSCPRAWCNWRRDTAFAQDDAEASTAQWRKVADQLRPKLPKLAGLLDEADVPAYMTFPRQHRTK